MTDPDLETMRLPLGDKTCPGGGYMVRPYQGQKKAWRYLCDEPAEEPRQIMVDGSTLQKQSGTGLLPGEYLNSRVIQCGEDPNYPDGGVIVEGQLGQTNFVVTNQCPGCVRSETAVTAEKKMWGGLAMKGTPMTVNGKAYMRYQNAKGIIMKCLDAGMADPPDPPGDRGWEDRGDRGDRDWEDRDRGDRDRGDRERGGRHR
jgi:hypothetical protein